YRIDVALRFRAKVWRGAVAGEEPVYLRCSGVWMPGISIDLSDLNHASQVHSETSAGSAGLEKEVCGGLIFFGWQKPISERSQVRAVGIDRSGQQRQLRFRAGVIFGRRSQGFEFELFSRSAADIAIDGDNNLRLGSQC